MATSKFSFRQLFLNFRSELLTMYFAIRHRETPWYAKLLIIFSIIYTLSPIDILPDYIPFIGWIDDLLIIPVIYNVVFSIIPGSILTESREKGKQFYRKAKNRILLFVTLWIIIWAILLYLTIKWVLILVHGIN